MVVADLEVHSRFARACSKDLNPIELNAWAKRKGVHLLSSGDITHPLWRREVNKLVEERSPGFFTLKDEKSNPFAPRFVLGGEVSLMFRQGEQKGRRVHLMFLAPSFEAVEALVAKINDKGKLASDGRVILSMSCRDFAKACQEVDPNILVIPAHIWTPWFGLLGSKSGFDSVEACFEDMAPTIKAYETGLSADPPMCWRVDSLNKRVLLSGSDLHSAPNMMREATIFNGEIQDYDYARLAQAISKVGHQDYWGTLEFYPQEGKYHADGHASCKVVLEPEQTEKLNGRCPVCGRPLTIGVDHRVHDLANHPVGFRPETSGQVRYSIPLQEIIADAFGKNKQSKSVQAVYFELTDRVDTEYNLLHVRTEFPSWIPARIIQGIYKVRQNEVVIHPGYDGIYGRINLFDDHTSESMTLWESS